MKRTKEKLTALFLGTVMIVSLTGCGDVSQESQIDLAVQQIESFQYEEALAENKANTMESRVKGQGD